MKKLTLVALIGSTLLTGCAQQTALIAPEKEVPLQSVKITASGDAGDKFAAVQQCVLDNVMPPTQGQLFTFMSDKTNSLAFVLTGNVSKGEWIVDPFTAAMAGVEPTAFKYAYKVSIRYNGKQEVISANATDLQLPARSGLTGAERTMLYTNDINLDANNVVNKIASCVPNYL